MSHAEIETSFLSRSRGNDLSLIEGNKGLFDGLDVEGTDSNAALASLLSTPVILVIDSHGMTRGIAPLINGYLDFDSDLVIRGVILNKVGGSRHESKLRAALERYTDLEVLGAIGHDKTLQIPERHLGLVPTNESRNAESTIARLSDAVETGVDIERIIEIAEADGKTSLPAATRPSPGRFDVRIAIARDAAFSFYYEDDLEAFAQAGAELVPFDTLTDPALPDVDGLFIGGGFPETNLPALSNNKGLLSCIRQALDAGLPAYAECGGLMYLARSIRWQDKTFDMVGTVAGDILVENRPQGRGYVVLDETDNSPWPKLSDSPQKCAGRIPAHEFHYARMADPIDSANFAFKVVRGFGIDGTFDGLVVGNLLAGFSHQRNTVSNPWVERFIAFVREIRQQRNSGTIDLNTE